jgi:hypothetical protein
MLFFVFGLPGRFSQWCETVVAELARHAGGTAEVIRADTLEQIAFEAIRTGASHAVVSSPQPGGRLRAALVNQRRNFIVAIDAPRRVLLDLVLDQQIELAAAVQQLASGCAVLSGVAATPGALTLHRDRDLPQMADTAADTVAAIARHLQIAIDAAAIAELAESRVVCEPARAEHDATAWWNGLEITQQELVIGALMPFVDDRSEGGRAESGELSVTWAHDLFFLGDRPQERASGPIDITGRARCLLHGPHIMLPPGAWSLSLTALLSRGAAEHEFAVEVCGDRVLAAGVIPAQSEGSAEVTLDFALDDAIEDPISIRIHSRRAAFDGAIVVVRATLVRAADTVPGGTAAEPALAGC